MLPETIAIAADHTPHLPRFRRASHEDMPAFRLMDRDRELLKVMYDYRFITAEMLQDLAPPVVLTARQQRALDHLVAKKRATAAVPVADGSQSRTKREILRRLQLMYHHGYVQRHKLSDHEPIVYALGNKGADVLTLYYGIDRQQIDWTTKNRETGERYIRHSLMVSRFRHAVTLAVRAFPDASVVFWEPNGAFTASVEYEQAVKTRDGVLNKRVTGTVKPDGFFALHDGQKTAYFCLEADRSTMTNARYLNKLTSYFHFWTTQIRGGQHPSGMKGFRVLTITLSSERKDNLRETARGVDPHGRGLGMFWFACERSYAARPQELLAAIWQTPTDDTLRSIFT